MDRQRMLEVVAQRFHQWNVTSRLVGEDDFIIEINDSTKTDRIMIRGNYPMDSKPIQFKMKCKGDKKLTQQDGIMIQEVQKVVNKAIGNE